MPTSTGSVTVIGGGLAGCEAAWQLATRGVAVTLMEMRPEVMTPAHTSGDLAELVCSNSLKSEDAQTAAGLLKAELELLGSMVLSVAREQRVPAGGALAVDRARFSAEVTRRVEEHPLITLQRGEASAIPDGPVIIATGPLSSASIEAALSAIVGAERLAFFDAAAPIVDEQSMDRSIVFAASRYGKGETADYLNAPMTREEYDVFYGALVGAARVHEKDFERRELFSACQPVEEVARSGRDALRFGALKPVGLEDPRTGVRPWAVVQLRAENASGSAYNLVGFQTNLTFPEQRRVFRLIPGLEDAEFFRYGVMHRNTFVDAPRVLDATLSVRATPRVRLAGQLTGTEGYVEAVASGLLAGLNTFAAVVGGEPAILPVTTAFGALVAYATDPMTTKYQPMHVNFGIIPPLKERVRGKRERYAAYSHRALSDLRAWLARRDDLRFAGGHFDG
ncbi:MAG: methylenetetrahydrofolate--tRNA-(uracil(54)-C(5))-methyltransferase (FADH(2)-oxidizing) TrmFO [Actinobacteria bacterium HGW-Actinobacteria-7]|nr:MAG: methylenetetrahydrofolate--tRNA-(uracil(54)-C(5))-methyltransferase (FADH(2)-oxidizing) TrmFO [Actinobacteria bacterium HGW-Actinobacteria-7]